MLDSIGDALTLTAGKYPDKTALINYSGHSFTYREFNERVNRLANALTDLGFEKGDKIAYLFLNCSQFLESHFAVAKAGCVGVPINFRLMGRELAYQISDCDASCVIYSGEFIPSINAIKGQLEKVRHFICDGDAGRDILNYEQLIERQGAHEPNVQVTLYDENLILYTAGTTGFPKGAVLTHKNSLFNAMAMIMDYGMNFREVFQVIPPLFHSASLNGVSLPGILCGSTLVLHSQFNPQDALQAIQDKNISITWGPATLLRMLIAFQDFGSYDTSSVRLVINGAMYMPAEMRQAVLSKFPSAKIADTYGMTEASPCTTILPPDRSLEKPASVGIPLTLCDVKIFNGAGQEAASGEEGEIVNRGNFMKGYYGRDEATAECIKGGWFYTGDMGKKDEDGFVYLVDRKKDMICSGGENVYSREVEEVIALYPNVFEVAVIGLPDEKWGEVVTAVVTPMPGTELKADELAVHCRKNLAGYKCPKIIRFTDSLPKNPSGKILKREIKKIYLKEGLA
ncbi:MAG: long-chain fatty acid--CoA ligase [Pseudomonadota bacterium]